MLKNFTNAPKSTILAVFLLSVFIGLKIGKFIEAETFGTLSALVIPLAFTDLLKERKPTE